MVVTEFQPLNPCVFQDELFAIEPDATLERAHEGDDTRVVVTMSSPCRHP